LTSIIKTLQRMMLKPALPHARLDRQHIRLYSAVTAQASGASRQSGRQHLSSIAASLREIEREEQRLMRATLWKAGTEPLWQPRTP
jgi:DNA-binding FadR family transcriptional regulator